jgi:hypothetical protein
MRRFAADQVPRLSVAAAELPGPWVVPWALPRRHKDRLVALLGQALCRFDDRLRFIELRWAERYFIEEGRIVPPQPALVWWRIAAIPAVEPESVIEAAPRLVPGLAVYDFEGEAELPALGWLGPLKVRLLHRLIDALMDDRLVFEPEDVVRTLNDAARTIVSPIDLLDLCESLIDLALLGRSADEARVEGISRVLASRFAPEAGDRAPADPLIEALGQLGSGERLPEAVGAILVRVMLLRVIKAIDQRHERRADVLARAGALVEAMAELAEAAGVHGMSARSFAYAGACFLDANHVEAAERVLQRARQSALELVDAADVLAVVNARWGHLRQRLDDVDGARVAF